MATIEASDSLREVKIQRNRRHTQGPAELEAQKIAKVRNKSVSELYDNQTTRRTGKVRHKSVPDFFESDMSEYTRQDFVYVNPGFVGSVNNVANNSDRTRQPTLPPASGTSVYREQYWVCSKWPHGQRILAITAGLLLGSVIGLIVTMVLSSKDTDILPGFLTRRTTLE